MKALFWIGGFALLLVVLATLPWQSRTSFDLFTNGLGGLLVFFAVAVLYVLPTVIASRRGRPAGWLGLMNVLLGWTIIGWLLCLVLAFSGPTRDRPAPLPTRPF